MIFISDKKLSQLIMAAVGLVFLLFGDKVFGSLIKIIGLIMIFTAIIGMLADTMKYQFAANLTNALIGIILFSFNNEIFNTLFKLMIAFLLVYFGYQLYQRLKLFKGYNKTLIGIGNILIIVLLFILLLVDGSASFLIRTLGAFLLLAGLSGFLNENKWI